MTSFKGNIPITLLSPGHAWILAGGLILPLLSAAPPYFVRPMPPPPAQTPQIETRSLFAGITYQRRWIAAPRRALVHVLQVDLRTQGVKPWVTPGTRVLAPEAEPWTADPIPAQTTSEALQKYGLQVAINASFFFPFSENTPWDYGPQRGAPAWVLGQTIHQGKLYGAARPGWPVLCFLPQRAEIQEEGRCPAGTDTAVAGNALLLKAGQPSTIPTYISDAVRHYPRTTVGVSAAGDTLWLVLVDGKQLGYSEGLPLAQVTELLQNLGAHTALNLDGGGSVTLAVQAGDGVDLLNVPIHAKIPGNQRPLANHLGFYALPK